MNGRGGKPPPSPGSCLPSPAAYDPLDTSDLDYQDREPERTIMVPAPQEQAPLLSPEERAPASPEYLPEPLPGLPGSPPEPRSPRDVRRPASAAEPLRRPSAAQVLDEPGLLLEEPDPDDRPTNLALLTIKEEAGSHASALLPPGAATGALGDDEESTVRNGPDGGGLAGARAPIRPGSPLVPSAQQRSERREPPSTAVPAALSDADDEKTTPVGGSRSKTAGPASTAALGDAADETTPVGGSALKPGGPASTATLGHATRRIAVVAMNEVSSGPDDTLGDSPDASLESAASMAPGAWSRSQAHPSPESEAPPHSEEIRAMAPAVRRRLTLVGVSVCALVAGMILFAPPEQPTRQQLRVLYPYGFEGAAGPRGERAPGAREVTIKLRGRVACARSSSELECLLYEYTAPGFSGTMVLRKEGDFWFRLSDEGMPFRPLPR